MNKFKLIKAGLHACLQDMGRVHSGQIGVAASGAADEHAHRWANWLCGNDETSGTLEILSGGVSLVAMSDMLIALTGAHDALCINQQQVGVWRSHRVAAGDRLDIGHASHGLRSYLACSGGLGLNPVLGSVANNAREKIGGHKGDGSPVAQHDMLVGSKGMIGKTRVAPKGAQAFCQHDTPIRVVLGYQHAQFSPLDVRRFFSQLYQVSHEQDRMGMRFTGTPIYVPDGPTVSEGIAYGAIQLPPDGLPIVMLKDRQTIGGYPKIGCVLPLDCFRLAQLPAGTDVRFKSIDVQEAQGIMQLYFAKQQRLKTLA